jgi:RHS repeat-associated protein
VYDGLGRLRKRLEYVNGTLQTTTLYLYDGRRVIQERDVNDNPTVSYTRGPDLSGSLEGAGGIGGLLARSSGYSSGNWTSHAYYHADGNGNITCLINASQSVVASYRYDPFGNTLSQSGSLAAANVYCFSSKEIHSNTNSVLYYYGYRFYDPSLQRWINRDPIEEEGGMNLYEFVGNEPTLQIDPFGFLFPWDPACKALEKKIDNIKKDIAKRLRELKEDKLKLPETCPGDDKKPSLSREGHRRIIKDLEDNLKKKQQLYKDNCHGYDPTDPAPKPSPPGPIIA